jgi:hypothetical protein
LQQQYILAELNTADVKASVDAFNRQMGELSTDFEYSVPKKINLYAIVEGQQV